MKTATRALRPVVFSILVVVVACSGDPGSTSEASASASSSSSSGDSTGDSVSSTSIGSSGAETTAGTSSETTTGAAPLCGDGIVVAGEICYGAPVRGALGQLPLNLAVADLDGDGREDLVVGTNTGSRLIFRGDGSTLVPSTSIDTPGSPNHAVAIADLDGDGVPELLAALNKSIEIHRQDGGVWSLAQTLPLLNPSLDLAVADLDHDGALDLVHGNWSLGTILALRGDGAGNFSAWQELAVGQRPRGMVIADLDHDGQEELIVALESCQGSYKHPDSTCDPSASAVVKGLGAASPSVELIPAGPYYNNRLALLDLDQDGVLDLVAITTDCYFAGVEPYCNAPASFAVHLGDGAAGFGPASLITVDEAPYGGAVADFDGDGLDDLAIGHHGPEGADPRGRVSIYPLPGDGSLGPATVLEGGSSVQAIATLEINGDGVPDLVIADSEELALQIFLSDP